MQSFVSAIIMIKIKQIFILLFLCTGILFSQGGDIPEVVTKVATASCNWLKLETSARAIGMGGAFVAAGEGISGIPYNPASIAFIKKSEGYYSRSNYIAGITHNVMSYGLKLGSSDYFGAHLFYLDSGLMDVTNEWYPDGTGEEFKVISMAFRMTYGRRMTDRLKLGVSINYIRDEIYTTAMQTLAFDVGSNFDTGIYGFILGMSVTNFGPEVRYHGEGLDVQVPGELNADSTLAKVTKKFPLPLTFRLGVKNDIMGPEGTFIKNSTHSLTVSVDGINPSDYTVYGSVGCEYGWRDFAFLRAGTHLGHDTAGLSVGGGIKVKTRGLGVSVDYAYVDYGILKMTHQVGLSLEF